MKRILIIGDSFACSQTSNKNNIGWPELLKNDYEITNLAQAGASEYKIYKQLKSVNIEEFDNIIICHTSFFRIPIENHPIYLNNELHKNCDLIFANDVSKKEIGFNSDFNKVSMIDQKGNIKILPKNKKSFIANKIAQILLNKLIDDRNIN